MYQVCLPTLIEPKRQTLLEINVHARLFGTLEYFFLNWEQKYVILFDETIEQN